ncbi:hypothetical protein BUALT_Bualt01G0102800 [Buddleja alternifolia]|uniref:Glycosyltransferase N-terminal domain-containing protein n=1 Tax=Buddleja alternifolia TaxID=168488 RepID=A0AAV6Y716_9LAMI|nr:hypothetical protein BUALT_Bualt01G0102800 [Buddleja alternifolia]
MANHYVKKEEYSTTDVAVVMLPFPAHGHMGPLLNFTSRLVSAATISLYFAGTSREIRRTMDRAHGWDPSSAANIHFHEFPTTPSLLPNTTILVGGIKQMRDPVYTFVKQLSTQYRRVVVVYDYLMSYLVQDINHHSIQNSEAYRFHAMSDCFSFCFHHKISTTDQPDDHDQLPPEAAEILKVTPSLDDCFDDLEFYRMVEGATKVFSGDIYNSNRKVEPLFLDLLEKRKVGGAEKVWALGPFIPVSVPGIRVSRTRHESLDWLDKQEPDSVVFVAFGTAVSISDKQIREIALGLERSEQKFIWVLRDADNDDSNANEGTKLSRLPLGFEDRVKERGMVVRDWAPQLEILGHSATGGFLSHCGWNSCWEGISHGLAMATWPFAFDNPSNAVFVTKVLKIGVEVLDWKHREEIVSADTVEKALRTLMASEEGEKIRKRAKELGNTVKQSLMESGNEMDLFIAHITR